MQVKDVMSRSAYVVREATPVKHVAEILRRHNIAAVPVVDDDDRVVGIVSEADLIWFQAEHVDVRTVADVMTRDVIVIDPEASVGRAAALMIEQGVKRLPVVDGDRLVGIVARHDLLMILARSDADIAHDVEHVLSALSIRLDVGVQDGVVRLQGADTEMTPGLARMIARTVPGVIAVDLVRDAMASH